jgi:uncharacterized protein (DUF111 family)
MTSEKKHGHSHADSAHEHNHDHEHAHCCAHEHSHEQETRKRLSGSILTVRAVSGLAGDMMLAGLARISGINQQELDSLTAGLRLPVPDGCVRIEPRCVNHVAGWSCRIELPHEHAHRTFKDITAIIGKSALTPRAANLAQNAFTLLAEAEGAVHGKNPADVTFHEVGALDSILDICLVCALFDRINPDHFICSPLPLGDGGVFCAHGWLPVPAPAVLQLLKGIPVCGFAGHGETVTPTAVALLKALGAGFGQWPEMTIRESALIYGGKIFENAPNGIIWAIGEAPPPQTPPAGDCDQEAARRAVCVRA